MHDLGTTAALSLSAFVESRIEPEIVFGVAAPPSADMDDAALLTCLDWVAHGFEIVQSIYPRWQFAVADTIAVNGLHGALVVGPRHATGPNAADWLRTLSRFEIDLLCNGQAIDRGNAANVLDGPLAALRHLTGVLARDPVSPPLAAGEIVTTGTLTRAMPVKPGEAWSTRLYGVALAGIRQRFD